MSLVVSKIEHASEASHWYTKDGIPAYEVMGKNGKMRSTTLRDAKQKNYIPSVTTIIKSAASPGLEKWKLDQMLLAALTLPKSDGESEKDYIERIRTDSRETGRQAADRGTAIHASIEAFYSGHGIKDYPEHIRGLENALNAHLGPQEWIAEKSFGSAMGFGGKVDLCCAGAVVDVKTKEISPDDPIPTYDEHVMQLAAYRVGLQIPKARCFNAFVSVTHPGYVAIAEWGEEELQRGWKMFLGLLDYWYAKSGLNRG